MKRFLKISGITVGVVLILGIIIGFMLPASHHVSRSVKIHAPLDTVFNQVNDLHNWERWSPWMQIDPMMQITYSNPHYGHNAFYVWESDDPEVGSGKMMLSDVVPNKRITIAMNIENSKDWTSKFDFKKVKDSVEVTWSMDLRVRKNPVSRWNGIFRRNSLNKMFDVGLSELKQTCEI